LISAQQYGSSHWGHTAKLTVKMPDGDQASYFLKVKKTTFLNKIPRTKREQVVELGDFGRQMCLGEFEALKAIHHVLPLAVPIPYAVGEFQKDRSKNFFLTDFREITRQVTMRASC